MQPNSKQPEHSVHQKTSDRLRARAWRILHDGLRHSDAAWCWALQTLGFPSPELIELEQAKAPFTDRELSLGAQQW